jgi:hypothetical protein
VFEKLWQKVPVPMQMGMEEDERPCKDIFPIHSAVTWTLYYYFAKSAFGIFYGQVDQSLVC